MTDTAARSSFVTSCPDCAGPVPRGATTCPTCRALIYRDRLGELADRARGEDAAAAIATWREALRLLPAASVQAKRIGERIRALEAEVSSGNEPAPGAPKDRGKASGNDAPRWITALGAAGLFLWKFKVVAVFLATKAKFLLAGLTKWKTLLSMVLALGVYWSLWGWWFALGFVLSVYVHEMGHVAALRRYGIPASPPMFIPGLGAFVAMKAYPETPVHDARVGLAGPAFGLGAALVCLAAYGVTGAPLMAALAHTGAFINLFNLLPLWQLDGGRAFESLSQRERWFATAAVTLCLVMSGETLLWLLLFGALYRVFATKAPATGDRRGLVYFTLLVAAFAALSVLPVPGVDGPLETPR